MSATRRAAEGEEPRLLREAARDFLAEELPPDRVDELDRACTAPPWFWERAADLGWTGLSVPEAYGGAGADISASVVIVEELARCFASMAVDYVLVAMAARILTEHAGDEQRAALLPALARGETLIAFGMTEPSGGTDVLGLQTSAALDGDRWLVSGQKVYCSAADRADQILVLARTDAAADGRRASGLSLLLVPRHQQGVETRRMELMGMRAAGTCEVFFDAAVAPVGALVGERGCGFHQLRSTLDDERILAAALSLGIAGAALDETIRYAGERTAFGRPIGAYQAVQHPLARTAVELVQARLLVEEATDLRRRGEECTLEAAMAKYAAAELAVAATDRGMRIFAAHGLVAGSHIERLFRDARVQVFSPLTNEMALNVIGERLGLPRSY